MKQAKYGDRCSGERKIMRNKSEVPRDPPVPHRTLTLSVDRRTIGKADGTWTLDAEETGSST